MISVTRHLEESTMTPPPPLGRSTPHDAPPPLSPALPGGPAEPSSPRRPLDMRSVRLDPSGSLGAWQDLNGSATIPHCIQHVESSGVIDNLRRLVGESGADHQGFVFADSDLFKVIEAVAWEKGRTGTSSFDPWLDQVISLVARAQEPSGYLHSWIQGVHPEKKFAELHWTHEMYVLGHWIQAAIALDRCTGRHDLLDMAIRFVDLVDRRFGPSREEGIDGHPEIETALVELFRHTGQHRYLELAQRFVDLRGHGTLPVGGFGGRYFQDHTPVREATDPTGHAVRQLYLNAGVIDLHLETAEQALLDVMLEQWDRTHERKMYISGAFGSRHRDESFGNDYELPPDRAYAETCATIADLHWTWRMMLASDDRRFPDVMEREIHNALAASIDATGTRFFYSNPLQRRPDRFSEENAPAERQEWYSCACCPPNIARVIAQLHAYVAALVPASAGRGPELEILQYTAADIDLPSEVGSGTLRIDTAYPSDGEITLASAPRSPVRFAEGARVTLRIPGWVRRGHLSTTAGSRRELDETELSTGKVVLDAADVIGTSLHLDMTPHWVTAHPRVDAVRGTAALQRGPLVYCLEQADMPRGMDVDDIRIHADHPVEESAAPGVGPGPALDLHVTHDHDDGPLLRTAPRAAGSPAPSNRATATVHAVPFAAWGNRGPGAMRVWLPLDS